MIQKTILSDGVTITVSELTLDCYRSLLFALKDTELKNESVQQYLIENPIDALNRIKQVVTASKPINKFNDTQQNDTLNLFIDLNPSIFKQSPDEAKRQATAAARGMKLRTDTANDTLKNIDIGIIALIANGHTNPFSYSYNFYDFAIRQ
jgi:hypothetical protein